jgi:predicted porin
VKKIGRILVASTAAIALCGVAHAADVSSAPIYSKEPPPPLAPASCSSAVQFIVTDCPLTYYGITVYGAIDLGGGYESHGAPFNKDIPTGVEELIRKNSNHGGWFLTPNGLAQSNIGIKGREAITSGLDFVFDLNFGFNPYSLTAANGPASLLDSNGIALAHQVSNADSSRAGQWYNGVGYAGFSSAYGTLTFGRQNTLALDGAAVYDPMGLSYAFSVIGWQGTAVGGGDTEDARSSTAIKYRADVYNWFRVSALYQVGGYENNNATQGQWGAGIGKDIDLGAYGKLAFDAIYTEDKGAVAASALSAAAALTAPNTIGATISDNNSIMLLGKYTYHQLRLYAGYEYINFANPSTPLTAGFTGIAGIGILLPNIAQTTYTNNEHLQIMWAGARYAFTPTVDAGIAYYHYDQNSYGTKGFCADASLGTCAGQLNAVAFDVDWQFAKKFDLYAGMMYSAVANGLANGYLFRNNYAPTAGLRFRF